MHFGAQNNARCSNPKELLERGKELARRGADRYNFQPLDQFRSRAASGAYKNLFTANLGLSGVATLLALFISYRTSAPAK